MALHDLLLLPTFLVNKVMMVLFTSDCNASLLGTVTYS